jgi:hypothetical protein
VNERGEVRERGAATMRTFSRYRVHAPRQRAPLEITGRSSRCGGMNRPDVAAYQQLASDVSVAGDSSMMSGGICHHG